MCSIGHLYYGLKKQDYTLSLPATLLLNTYKHALRRASAFIYTVLLAYVLQRSPFSELKAVVGCVSRRLVDRIVLWAVVVANAAVYEHHGPLDRFPFQALELHLRCSSAVWCAAAAIGAQAAETGPEGLDAGAVLVGEVDGSRALLHPETLAPLLQ